MEALALTYDEYVREVLVIHPWKEFDLPRRGRVLEIGSGLGWGLSALRSLGLDATGIDLKPKGKGILQADAALLPFRHDSFDGALCLRTLSHVRDDRAVLTEIARALRPGGFLLLAVGNRQSYTLLRLRQKLPNVTPNPEDRYYHLYGRNEIRSALEDAGFRIANFRSCHYIPRGLDGAALWRHRTPKRLAQEDAAIGRNPLLGLVGPLQLVHGVKR